MTNTTNIKTADGWTHLNNLEILNDTYIQGNLTVLGSINGEDQVVTGITAHAGGGQSSATSLTLGAFNNITVVASSADSVKIPASAVGATLIVSNQGANAAQIFGTSPDTINGVATGTGISIPVGAIFVFTCAVVGNWLQNVQTGGAFTGTFDGVLGGNTPAAVTATTLTASGATATGALTVTGAASATTTVTAGTYLLRSVGNALTAVGTNRGTALQLAKQVNNVTTAAGGTGVILPVGVIGMRITIFNAGANAIQVYASASETIDTVAGSTGVPLSNTKRADFFFTAANTWISAQLGVVSA